MDPTSRDTVRNTAALTSEISGREDKVGAEVGVKGVIEDKGGASMQEVARAADGVQALKLGVSRFGEQKVMLL